MDDPKVPPLSAVGQLAEVLDSPEITALVFGLETTRWAVPATRSGRWWHGARQVDLRRPDVDAHRCACFRAHGACGVVAPYGDVPSVYASYRFAAKLRAYSDMLTGCIDRVTAGLSV